MYQVPRKAGTESGNTAQIGRKKIPDVGTNSLYQAE